MLQTLDRTHLSNCLLFKDIDDSVLEAVIPHCSLMDFDAGDTLFEQDDESNALYILLSGQIHVVRTYPDGDEVILATESPYYVIGELSMLAHQPRTGSVVAVSDCELLKINREAIENICNENPHIAVSALKHMGQRLYRLNLSVRESSAGRIEARVATVLLLRELQEFTVSMPRLARATALDTDQVAYILKQWAQDGVISLNKNSVRIEDESALQRIAG